MNIHEYQAKEIFRKYGIPIPPGEVARTAEEAEAIARRFATTVVVKAQVYAGGRGKAGGVKLAKTPEEARNVAAQSLKFDTDCLAAPANQDFAIAFDNKDAGVPHNVDIYDKQGGTHVAAANGVSDTVTGVATTTYKVSGLKAGTYFFQCDVHPTAMFGTFIVK